MAKQSQRSNVFWITLLVALGAVIMLIPFAWAVLTSLNPDATISINDSIWPERFDISGYTALFETLPFFKVILNSVGIAIIVTTIQIATAAPAAYAFSRFNFKGQNAVFVGYLATMMIPFQVLLVPLFIQMRIFGLIDSYASVVLPAMASAFGVFLLRQAINQVPRELDDAATVDGASHLRIFTRIILPSIKPALATFGIFAFMASWNGFIWPLIVLRSPEIQTLPVALAGIQGQYTTEWNIVMAGSVISMIPIFLVYVFAQRSVVQGITSAGIK